MPEPGRLHQCIREANVKNKKARKAAVGPRCACQCAPKPRRLHLVEPIGLALRERVPTFRLPHWSEAASFALALDFALAPTPSNAGSRSCTLSTSSGSTVNNSNSCSVSGVVDNYGSLNNLSGASICIQDTGELDNYGTLNNETGATLTNGGALNNRGTFCFSVQLPIEII